MQNKTTLFTYLVIGFGLLGLIFSATLVQFHVNPKTDSAIVKGMCDPNETDSCKKAVSSGASEALGLPIALWGFMFYAGILVLAIFFLITNSSFMMQTVFVGGGLAVLIDTMLLIYSLVKLDALCTLCVITYVASVGIAVCSYLAIKNSMKENFSLIPKFASLKGQSLSLTVGLVCALLLAPSTGFLLHAQAQAQLSQGHSHGDVGDDPNVYIKKAGEAFVKQYRKHIHERVQKWKVVKALKGTKLYSIYQTVSKVRG